MDPVKWEQQSVQFLALRFLQAAFLLTQGAQYQGRVMAVLEARMLLTEGQGSLKQLRVQHGEWLELNTAHTSPFHFTGISKARILPYYLERSAQWAGHTQTATKASQHTYSTVGAGKAHFFWAQVRQARRLHWQQSPSTCYVVFCSASHPPITELDHTDCFGGG